MNQSTACPPLTEANPNAAAMRCERLSLCSANCPLRQSTSTLRDPPASTASRSRRLEATFHSPAAAIPLQALPQPDRRSRSAFLPSHQAAILPLTTQLQPLSQLPVVATFVAAWPVKVSHAQCTQRSLLFRSPPGVLLPSGSLRSEQSAPETHRSVTPDCPSLPKLPYSGSYT